MPRRTTRKDADGCGRPLDAATDDRPSRRRMRAAWTEARRLPTPLRVEPGGGDHDPDGDARATGGGGGPVAGAQRCAAPLTRPAACFPARARRPLLPVLRG